jgi:hypothetical protein
LRHPPSNSALDRLGGKPTSEKLAQTLSRISERNETESAALNIFYADIAVASSRSNAYGFVNCLERIATDVLNTNTHIKAFTQSLILDSKFGFGKRFSAATGIKLRVILVMYFMRFFAEF